MRLATKVVNEVVRERPILFSAPMVRAILEGRKTQTRRIVKPQPPAHLGETPGAAWNAGFVDVKCPYGAPGDRLWVRETWAPADCMYGEESDPPRTVGYEADRSARQWGVTGRRGYRDIGKIDLASWNWETLTWRPSIHMPRWASRITLEVTGVCVERLHDISSHDVVAEGIDPAPHRCDCEICAQTSEHCTATASSLVMEFKQLWDNINAKRAPWASNPWVWVVEFRRVDATEGKAR